MTASEQTPPLGRMGDGETVLVYMVHHLSLDELELLAHSAEPGLCECKDYKLCPICRDTRAFRRAVKALTPATVISLIRRARKTDEVARWPKCEVCETPVLHTLCRTCA